MAPKEDMKDAWDREKVLRSGVGQEPAQSPQSRGISEASVTHSVPEADLQLSNQTANSNSNSLLATTHSLITQCSNYPDVDYMESNFPTVFLGTSNDISYIYST